MHAPPFVQAWKSLSLAVAVAAAAGCATADLARQPRGGRVELNGRVVDGSTGEPIAGVKITLSDEAGRPVFATTEDDGLFRFAVLRAQPHQLQVAHPAYAESLKLPLVLRSGVPTHLALKLHKQPPAETLPILVDDPLVSYPAEALAYKAEGTVVIACTLTAEGVARDCKIQQGVKYLDEAALQAVQARRYAPATKNGQPVEVAYTFRVKLSPPQ